MEFTMDYYDRYYMEDLFNKLARRLDAIEQRQKAIEQAQKEILEELQPHSIKLDKPQAKPDAGQ